MLELESNLRVRGRELNDGLRHVPRLSFRVTQKLSARRRVEEKTAYSNGSPYVSSGGAQLATDTAFDDEAGALLFLSPPSVDGHTRCRCDAGQGFAAESRGVSMSNRSVGPLILLVA